MKILVILSLLLSCSLSNAQSSSSEILRRAEVMPVFKNCENERYSNSPYSCTINQLSDHINRSVVVENSIGMITKCLVSLVVEKDGTVSDVKLPRGVVINIDDAQQKQLLEKELDTKIFDALEKLNFLMPGYHNGEKARVMLQFSASINY